MKKNLFFIAIIFLISACSGSPENQAPVNPGTENQDPAIASPINADYENALSVEMQLALGSFALESTDQSITSEQAENLATLWKAVRSLSESETVAAAELAAVFNQIQNTFTNDQIAAIAEMELTFEDMPLIAETMGIELGRGTGEFNPEDLSPEDQATREAIRASGEIPPGGGPGGGLPGGGLGGRAGGGGPGGEGLSPEARQTAIAERGGLRRVTNGVNPLILEAVINFLIEKSP